MRGLRWSSMFGTERVRIALSLLAVIACTAADASDALIGTWRGTSLCTPVRPACHDEIAVYHVAPSPKADTVLMMMNKVVDGKEVEMGGTVEYHVDAAAHTLSYEFVTRDGTHCVFGFTWSGRKMTGTLIQLPGREVIRNITLEKD